MVDLEKYGIYKGEGKIHEEVIYPLALVYGLVNNEISTFLQKYKLSSGKLNILIAIKHHGGKKGLPQVEISKHLIVTKSNMTKLIDKLEQEGLVTRSSLEGDRRVNITKITKKAGRLLDSIWEEYNLKLKSLLKDIDKKKQRKLSALLIEWLGKLAD